MISDEVKDQTWKQVRRGLGFPNVNDPVFTEEGPMKDEIAAIDMKSKQIMVNEGNLEQRVGADMLRPVEAHEVMHYKAYPKTLRNYVRLVAYSHAVLDNVENAKLVENLFTDLLINTYLFGIGETNIARVYQRLSARREQPSELWDFYIETFAGMIGKKTSTSSLSEKQRADAKQLSDILKDSVGNSKEWPTSITEFAKAVKDYLDKNKGNQGQQSNGSGASSPQSNGNGNQSQGQNDPSQQGQTYSGDGNNSKSDNKQAPPLIDKHDVDDFVPFDRSQATPDQQKRYFEKELKGVGAELARELGSDDKGKQVYSDVLSGLGIGTSKQAKIWFYRDLVSAYDLKMPNVESTSGRRRRQNPRKCKLGKFHEADQHYTLSQYPGFNPLFLYRWNYASGESARPGRDRPYLLLAPDTSGSMDDPDQTVSYALVSAMIAKKTALRFKSKVAVVNFSTQYLVQDFTISEEKLDEALSHYFGGGTNIPGQAIYETVAREKHPSHILIISDTSISDLDKEVGYLERALKACRAGGTIFLSSAPVEETKLLQKIGFDVIPTRSFSDMDELTLKKAGEIYTT
ncbi:hypothetical protein ACFLZ6_01455 [Nanoarchaeota archaeon]